MRCILRVMGGECCVASKGFRQISRIAMEDTMDSFVESQRTLVLRFSMLTMHNFIGYNDSLIINGYHLYFKVFVSGQHKQLDG